MLLSFTLATNTYSQEISPPVTEKKVEAGKRAIESSTGSNVKAEHNNDSPQDVMPTINKKDIAHPSNAKAQNADTKDSNMNPGIVEDPMLTYTLWIMLFTGGLFFCNIFLLVATKKSADAAKIAAEAARKSVEIIPTIEQAYIYVSSVSADFESWRHVKGNQRSPIEITVHNYGKTPAKLVNFSTKIKIGISNGRQIDWGDPDDDEIIDAVGRFVASSSSERFSYYIHDAIGDGDYHIVFSGEVKYRDIFEKDHTAFFDWDLVSRFKRGFYINNPEANYTT